MSLVMQIPPDVEIQQRLTAFRIEEWLQHDVLSFKWWVLLGTLVIVFLVWNYLVKKEAPYKIRTWLYATLAAISFMGVFEWGEELVLWNFPIDVIPVFPPLSSLNLMALPLAYSLVYQRFIAWKEFLAAVAIITAVFCFAVEPALSRTGFYELLKWKYYYAYLIYFGLALSIKIVVDAIYRTESRFAKNLGWRATD